MILIVFRHVKVDRAVADVGISGIENFLDIFDLLDYMARGAEPIDGGNTFSASIAL